MIKLEKTEVVGWEAAIRGMRNPMNSWEKSDSGYCHCRTETGEGCNKNCLLLDVDPITCYDSNPYIIGPNDLDLMKRLRNAGTDHRKFMRMIVVYVDITAPLYWWKEFDTYKVGTVANSCSTMHKIADKGFELGDFSCEHLIPACRLRLKDTIEILNEIRDLYLGFGGFKYKYGEYDKKKYWWQMIQLLPSSYNQKRTVMMSYEVLANIYKSRKNHKLDEWSVGFMDWINTLPYSELITGDFISRED